jgi:hypothetical protein
MTREIVNVAVHRDSVELAKFLIHQVGQNQINELPGNTASGGRLILRCETAEPLQIIKNLKSILGEGHFAFLSEVAVSRAGSNN